MRSKDFGFGDIKSKPWKDPSKLDQTNIQSTVGQPKPSSTRQCHRLCSGYAQVGQPFLISTLCCLSDCYDLVSEHNDVTHLKQET